MLWKKLEILLLLAVKKTVKEKLIDFIDTVGPFGTLLLTGHDVGNSKKLWEDSFSIMSNNLRPILSDYIQQKFKG